MTFIKNVQQYLNRNDIDIAFLFVIVGMLLSSFIEYAWMVSILACLFIKDEEKQANS